MNITITATTRRGLSAFLKECILAADAGTLSASRREFLDEKTPWWAEDPSRENVGLPPKVS